MRIRLLYTGLMSRAEAAGRSCLFMNKAHDACMGPFGVTPALKAATVAIPIIHTAAATPT